MLESGCLALPSCLSPVSAAELAPQPSLSLGSAFAAAAALWRSSSEAPPGDEPREGCSGAAAAPAWSGEEGASEESEGEADALLAQAVLGLGDAEHLMRHGRVTAELDAFRAGNGRMLETASQLAKSRGRLPARSGSQSGLAFALPPFAAYASGEAAQLDLVPGLLKPLAAPAAELMPPFLSRPSPPPGLPRLHPATPPLLPFRSCKIFVGGLPASVDDRALCGYFGVFGSIRDVVVMYDRDSRRPRGFGFVTFAHDSAVDRVLALGSLHRLGNKQVEVKRAIPRECMAVLAQPEGGPSRDLRAPALAQAAGALRGHEALAAAHAHKAAQARLLQPPVLGQPFGSLIESAVLGGHEGLPPAGAPPPLLSHSCAALLAQHARNLRALGRPGSAPEDGPLRSLEAGGHVLLPARPLLPGGEPWQGEAPAAPQLCASEEAQAAQWLSKSLFGAALQVPAERQAWDPAWCALDPAGAPRTAAPLADNPLLGPPWGAASVAETHSRPAPALPGGVSNPPPPRLESLGCEVLGIEDLTDQLLALMQ